jgi:3-hydroxy-3-methylglutaryl CoA synthase
VNAEFNMTEGGPLFPANFQLKGHEELEHVLPSYTIGEAATATLLLPDRPENFRFTFPFSAMEAALHHHLGQELPHLLKKAGLTGQEADIVFTHSSSSTEWNRAGQENGFAHKIYHTYPYTGNIVSASIPVALAQADGVGRLKEGHRVMCFMGSAGMSFAACT